MKCIPVAAALLSVSLAGNALTLGKARGSAIVGRPLDLSISVQAADGEAIAASCFNAEVFYGEFRQEAQRITVTEIAPQQDTAMRQLQILSSTPVNEPVVTLWVIAGCEQKIKRRFVFFADVESVLDTPSHAEPRLNERKALNTAPVTLTNPSPSNREKTDHEPLPPQKTAKTKSKFRIAAPAQTKQKPATQKDVPKESLQEARLTERIDALAQWQASNLTPEALEKRSEQLRLLEGQMKTLREVAQKNQTALNQVGAQLEQAQKSNNHPLVVGLGTLCVLLASALAFVLIRSRTDKPKGSAWWGESTSLSTNLSVVVTGSRPSSVLPTTREDPENVVASDKATSAAAQSSEPSGIWASDLDIDLDFGELTDVVDNAPTVATPASEEIGQAPSVGPRDELPNNLNLREMMDVRQQAEFYMTLGQQDEAIGVLTTTIEGEGNVNPLVYLDLLKILHTLSRKDPFDHYRNEFNRLFSGRVPEYALFTEAGRALETYEAVCQEIVARWPTPSALLFIESQLIRHPQHENASFFDLEAYRDLLLLHGVLKRLGGEIESDFAPFSAPKSSDFTAPTQSEVDIAIAHIDLPDLSAASALTSPIDIDFDLSEDETKPAPTELPEIPSDNLIDFDLSDLPGKREK